MKEEHPNEPVPEAPSPADPIVSFRIFLQNEETKEPAAGRNVLIQGEKDGGDTQLVAILNSSATGYVAFKADPSELDDYVALVASVETADGPSARLSLSDPSQFAVAHTIPTRFSALPATPPAGPAIVRPDVTDAMISGASIGILPKPGIACSQFVPSGLTTAQFQGVQFLIDDPCRFLKVQCPNGSDGKPTEFSIQYGKALFFDVVWYPLGFSLGDLVYSVSLAPCESTKLAVRDWTRETWAKRSEDSTATERQTSEFDRNGTILETMVGATAGFGAAKGGAVKGSLGG